MLTVATIIEYLEELAPLRMAADWDNVGLLLGDTATPVRKVMTCLTVTPESAAEAVAQLKAARQLGEALSQSARQQGAHGLSSHDGDQAWQHHTDQMDPQAQGRYEGSVGGQEAKKAQGRALTDPVERFAKPLLHLDTHAKLVQYIKLGQQVVGSGSEKVRAPRLELAGEERAHIIGLYEKAIATRPTLSGRAKAVA